MTDFTHGGNLRALAAESGREDLIDFSANINPLGPPTYLRQTISAHVSDLLHYPDPEYLALREAAARRYDVDVEQIVCGNGTGEILRSLPFALHARAALLVEPCYADYRAALERCAISPAVYALSASNQFALDFDQLDQALAAQPADCIVFLGRPNNPTGLSFSAEALRSLAARHARCWFVIDEAFGEFIEGFESLTTQRPANVVVLLSLTKAYAIPGLRLALAIADAPIAACLREALPPWSVNALAQAFGCEALADHEYLARTRAEVTCLRAALLARLQTIPHLRAFPGEANYLLLQLIDAPFTVEELRRRMLARGIALRDCANYRSMPAGFFRIAVRSDDENEQLCRALAQELGAPHLFAAPRRRTPALMMQGLTSNAGKSVLTAALCRILLQDGVDVAPFKAQNMSLNSHVTRAGGEIGRAQALQAQACRLEPDVRMNPVLLKPNSDHGSQVIVLGQPVAQMQAREYFSQKQTLADTVHEAYDALAAEHEAIVLEGAGSPAEVNLMSRDIVNMSMAIYAHAPALIIGDIDRGGVYASFVGAMEVFDEQQRAQVAGFIVNRFRGDASLLAPAHAYVERTTGRGVLGVVPYFHDLALPEEDSVSFKEAPRAAAIAGCLDIALIDLPHISNFTDVDALRVEPDVRLRVVRSADELGAPDAMILPGSRNVPNDLAALRRLGLDRAITALAANKQCEIVGICGGFQMLGRCIDDPHRLESSDAAACAGLDLLPVSTTLAVAKILRRTIARDCATGCEVEGYEIHHGVTNLQDAEPALIESDGSPHGARTPDGRIWGVYLHGIFDRDGFRRAWIDRLRERKGLSPIGRVIATYDLEPALDRLADRVREALPIARIKRIMGL